MNNKYLFLIDDTRTGDVFGYSISAVTEEEAVRIFIKNKFPLIPDMTKDELVDLLRDYDIYLYIMNSNSITSLY